MLGNILKSAANPNNERIDVVISTLPERRKKNVQKTARAVGNVTKTIAERGKLGLMEISETEFQELVNAANKDNPQGAE